MSPGTDGVQLDPDPKTDFDPRFRRLVARLRRRAALRAMARLLPWLQAAWLALFLAERLTALELPVTLTAVAAVLIAVLFGAAVLAGLRAPRGGEAALVLDRRLGTRELVTAAREAGASSSHPIVRRVRRRAAQVLAEPRAVQAFPLTHPKAWRPALLALVAILLAAGLPRWQPTVEATPIVDPAVPAAAEVLSQDLADLGEDLGLEERPESLDVFEQLEDLIEEMRRGETATVDEALVELAKLESALEEIQRDPATAGFDNLVQDLGAEPIASELALAMTAADRDALRRTLQEMADSLTGPEAQSRSREQETERLAERLEALAEALERAGDSESAAALREVARALSSGDLERARRLLESDGVAGACEAGGAASNRDRLAGQLRELTQLGRYLLGMGWPQPLETAGGGGQGSQPGAGQAAGPRPGTGSTNEEAAGYDTGSPILRDRQADATSGREGDFEALHDPRRTAPEGSEDVRFSGGLGDRGEILAEEGRGLGVGGEATAPLRRLAAAAEGGPEHAADLESIPLGYRDLVRNYFERERGRAPAPAAGDESPPPEEGDSR